MEENEIVVIKTRLGRPELLKFLESQFRSSTGDYLVPKIGDYIEFTKDPHTEIEVRVRGILEVTPNPDCRDREWFYHRSPWGKGVNLVHAGASEEKIGISRGGGPGWSGTFFEMKISKLNDFLDSEMHLTVSDVMNRLYSKDVIYDRLNSLFTTPPDSALKSTLEER